jgi:hypothetical protein
MQLGETIATYDIALALRGESGKFDVTSPAGETYRVVCKPDSSISSLEWSGDGADSHPFLIRKVAEPVSQEAGKTAPVEGGTQSRTGRAPFLIEGHGEDGITAPRRESSAQLPAPVQSEIETSQVFGLDLVYGEGDAESTQASAHIAVGNGQDGRKTQRLVTAPCATFNELDAEIRRLHAQLDDIRYRARKKFYETHAMAAGA